MDTFRGALRELMRWALDDRESSDIKMNRASNHNMAPSPVGSIGSSSVGDYSRGMNFTVFNAAGGKVIQISTYNQRTDQMVTNLHVIMDNEDLGEELALIITKESLTR
jgi:hypothetical protein